MASPCQPTPPPCAPAGLQIHTEAQTARIRISGDVDTATTGILAQLLAALWAEGHRQILLDFSAVGFLGPAGTRLLIHTHHSVTSQGGTLRLSGLTGQPCRLLSTTGLAPDLT